MLGLAGLDVGGVGDGDEGFRFVGGLGFLG